MARKKIKEIIQSRQEKKSVEHKQKKVKIKYCTKNRETTKNWINLLFDETDYIEYLYNRSVRYTIERCLARFVIHDWQLRAIWSSNPCIRCSDVFSYRSVRNSSIGTIPICCTFCLWIRWSQNKNNVLCCVVCTICCSIWKLEKWPYHTLQTSRASRNENNNNRQRWYRKQYWYDCWLRS